MSMLTGGKVNYYLVQVEHPQREDQPPYQAECEDIAEALQLTPNEFCEFKAIWRTAAARLGNGKPDHKALYDAEKRVHYATRDLRKLEREKDKSSVPCLSDKAMQTLREEVAETSPGGWIAHIGESMPEGLTGGELIQVRMDNGHAVVSPRRADQWRWGKIPSARNIEAWRFA